jgi:hypothetical protein
MLLEWYNDIRGQWSAEEFVEGEILRFAQDDSRSAQDDNNPGTF